MWKIRYRRSSYVYGATLAMAWIASLGSAQDADLFDLTIEQLLDIEVTSVSRRAQSLSSAAAAVFVITADDIRRSGATSIPEILRMAPGVQVAQIDANKWAVSARGFNGRFSNKLLVLMDGRTLYTPLFSGVYWDVQSTDLESIDRIEIIRGPGATLWGANAVNGVINIITKSAKDQPGGSMRAGVSSKQDVFFNAGFGGELAKRAQYRVYGQYQDAGGNVDVAGADTDDDWDLARLGFRMDFSHGTGSKTSILAETYDGKMGGTYTNYTLTPPYTQPLSVGEEVSGSHVLGRWEKDVNSASTIVVQSYWDQSERLGFYFSEDRTTLEVDYQQNLSGPGRHSLVWGGSYRLSDDALTDSFLVRIPRLQRRQELFSAFIQDEIAFANDWSVVIGAKFEHNSFTIEAFETEPNIRMVKAISEDTSLWASIAQSYRTPSRTELDAQVAVGLLPPASPGNPWSVPTVFGVIGNSNVTSEELTAYELGYRTRPTENISLDFALFLNDYANLRSVVQGAPFCVPAGPMTEVPACLPSANVVVVPFFLASTNDTESYGAEAVVEWLPKDRWGLQAAYSFLDFHHSGAGSESGNVDAFNSKHQLSARLRAPLGSKSEILAWWRYTDALGGDSVVSGFSTIDLSIIWRPARQLEIALTGKNLLDKAHLEFISELNDLPPTYIERTAALQARWSF